MAHARQPDQVLGTVPRQRREEIRVSVRRAHGRKVLDIRVFIEDDLSQMIPTARGIALGEEDWKSLRKVLAQLKGGRAGVSAPAQPNN